MQFTHAAIVACLSKEGWNHYQVMQEMLGSTAYENGNGGQKKRNRRVMAALISGI